MKAKTPGARPPDRRRLAEAVANGKAEPACFLVTTLTALRPFPDSGRSVPRRAAAGPPHLRGGRRGERQAGGGRQGVHRLSAAPAVLRREGQRASPRAEAISGLGFWPSSINLDAGVAHDLGPLVGLGLHGAAAASGVLLAPSKPICRRRSFTSGRSRMRATWALSVSTIGGRTGRYQHHHQKPTSCPGCRPGQRRQVGEERRALGRGDRERAIVPCRM